MAKKKEEVITKASIEKDSDMAVRTAEQERKALARQFRDQEYEAVQISPLYKPYFGNVMTVTINGTSVAVPVDGKTYKVPASFAEEIAIRISNRDELLEKHRRMSRVSENFETSPGKVKH